MIPFYTSTRAQEEEDTVRNERVVIAAAGSMLVVNWKREAKITPIRAGIPVIAAPVRQLPEIREGSARAPAAFG